jgi:hypothetical protein
MSSPLQARSPLWSTVLFFALWPDLEKLLLDLEFYVYVLYFVVCSFVPISFGHCGVCSSSIYGFRSPLWNLQTLFESDFLHQYPLKLLNLYINLHTYYVWHVVHVIAVGVIIVQNKRAWAALWDWALGAVTSTQWNYCTCIYLSTHTSSWHVVLVIAVGVIIVQNMMHLIR